MLIERQLKRFYKIKGWRFKWIYNLGSPCYQFWFDDVKLMKIFPEQIKHVTKKLKNKKPNKYDKFHALHLLNISKALKIFNKKSSKKYYINLTNYIYLIEVGKKYSELSSVHLSHKTINIQQILNKIEKCVPTTQDDYDYENSLPFE